MKFATFLFIAIVASGVTWWWIGSTLWTEAIPPAPAYAPVDEGTVPTLVRTVQLPPLPGYESPKPVVAAGAQGNVVVMAQGMTNTPLGTDIAALMVRRSCNWKSWEPPTSLSGATAEEIRMAAIDAIGPMVHVTWVERIADRRPVSSHVIRLKLNAIHDLNDGLLLEGDKHTLRWGDGRTTHGATANIWQHFRPQNKEAVT